MPTPGWKQELTDVKGLLTCGLIALYGVKREMEAWAETRKETK